MNPKTDTTPVLISLFHQPQTITGLPVVIKAGPLVTIPAHGRMQPVIVEITTTRPLSELIEIGRQYHPLCRRAFIEKRTTGYYHYERRTTWYTCAIAAAYAAAFGREEVQQPCFSYSMALWQLAPVIGYRANEMTVTGPTGRTQPVSEEIMQLVDVNFWTRQGIAEWLASEGL